MSQKANGSAAPAKVSIFADVAALKAKTAAKLGRLKSSTETASAEIVLHRPLAKWFFRTPDDDDMLFAGGTWLDPETRELYFVAPDMWEHELLVGAVRSTLFVPYVTAAVEGAGVRGIWPVSTAAGNSYNDSVNGEILPLSRTTWIRVWADTRIKKYRHYPAEDNYGQPIWLTKSIFEQLDIVFPGKKQILDEDHEIVAALKGRHPSEASDRPDRVERPSR